MILKKLSICAVISTACLFSACTEKSAGKEESPAEKPTVKAEVKAESAQVTEQESTLVTLHIKNGHLSKVILGIDEKATDGYDRGLDDMAPPPGMETGYTALVSPDKQMYLYRDSRKPAKLIEWIFYGKVHKDKAIGISWDKATLPASYTFEIQHGDHTVKMAEAESLEIAKDAGIIITATRK